MQEMEKEREIESLERELASVKVQLEVKEAAHKQALLKVDHYHKTSDELSTLLKSSDLKKNFYIEESQRSGSRVSELELALGRMTERLSEHEITREELVIVNEAKVELSSRVRALEALLTEEKLRVEELSKQVFETNGTITCLEAEILRVEEEKHDMLKDLNDRITQKAAHVESLQLEINELRSSSQKSAARIEDLEAETERVRSEAERAEAEAEKAREKENEAQVEIALLKYEVHKGLSRLCAAEAAEARAQNEKTALYNALHQMGLEAEEIKRENKILKEEASRPESRGLVQVEEELEGEGLSSRVEEEGEQPLQVEDVKKELEAALLKIGELRMRAEQAISRAEVAEKAKAALEEEKRKRRKHKERRRAALEALRQESISREFEVMKNDNGNDDDNDNVYVKSYQPLAKVLNMKF